MSYLQNENPFPLQKENGIYHEYKPIGTGECWACGQPFFKHLKAEGREG